MNTRLTADDIAAAYRARCLADSPTIFALDLRDFDALRIDGIFTLAQLQGLTLAITLCTEATERTSP